MKLFLSQWLSPQGTMLLMTDAQQVSTILPYHRFSACNGNLKDYACGLHRKHWLLTHEKAIASQKQAPHTTMLLGF